jgi:lipopolysaccharide biosynthesis glycosyltransferase
MISLHNYSIPGISDILVSMKKLVLQADVPGIETGHTFHYNKEMYSVSKEFAKRYAEKYGADYLCLTSLDDYAPIVENDKTATYLRLKAYELKNYDQIFYIDCDYIIKESAPNIFEIADGQTCVCRERAVDTIPVVAEIAERSKVPFERFFNAGMILFDRKDLDATQEDMFEYLKRDWDWDTWNEDQGLLNSLFNDKGINLKFLEPELWNPSLECFGEYADHYAGYRKQDWSADRYNK